MVSTNLCLVSEVHVGTDNGDAQLVVHPGFADAGIEERGFETGIRADQQDQIGLLNTYL